MVLVVAGSADSATAAVAVATVAAAAAAAATASAAAAAAYATPATAAATFPVAPTPSFSRCNSFSCLILTHFSVRSHTGEDSQCSSYTAGKKS